MNTLYKCLGVGAPLPDVPVHLPAHRPLRNGGRRTRRRQEEPQRRRRTRHPPRKSISAFRRFLDAVEMQNRKTHQNFIKFHQIHQSKFEKEKNQLNEANRIRFVAVDFKKSDIQMTFRIFKW